MALEKVGELGQKFDKVICTGVLHHLTDPDTGLQALRDTLKPDGIMHLMVYAAYGRTGVYMLQEYCRRLNVGITDQEINDLANTLMAIPADHPLAPLLGRAADFRTKVGLADALLHPQDRAYTVAQLFDFIEQAGLSFDRWLFQAPYLAKCGKIAGTPHGGRLSGLPPAEQYAAMELLRGTMVRHSLIVSRSDAPADDHILRLEDRPRQQFVPIRRHEALCVEERVPPQAAAVLLNQSNNDADLFLAIDNKEKRWFEAIDGQRTIGEILDRDPGRNEQSAKDGCHFFEKLWWYDLVVFDASANG